MEIDLVTAPFGRRKMTLAMLASQVNSKAVPNGKVVDKWKLYRLLCEGKAVIGVSDRSLAVLNALLTFYPETALSEEHGLIVFPSNAQLALRAHGMADATLRRHLATLVECGLIIRRDSPNGKRYARRGRGGEIDQAYGFSLAPLLARAEEFERIAAEIRAQARALRRTREEVTLLRRDIHKLIDIARAENIAGHWDILWKRFRAIVDAIPRRAGQPELQAVCAQLKELHIAISKLLESHIKAKNISANESQDERQQSNSNTEAPIESDLLSRKNLKHNSANISQTETQALAKAKAYPLETILRACPEISNYAPRGIGSWRDLAITAAQVKTYLGISGTVYEEALQALGVENTVAAIACILQRASHISSPGGYLRVLTRMARAGEFSAGPMLMAALRTNRASSGRKS
jgi:replication initiation protein RepC